MNRSTMSAWIACAGLAAVLGAGWGRSTPLSDAVRKETPPLHAAIPALNDSARPLHRARAGVPHHAVLSEETTTFDELWTRVILTGHQDEFGDLAWDALRGIASSNPAVLAQLLRRYDSALDEAARNRLQLLLAGIDCPEVVAFAIGLATSSDPAKRRDGFELLHRLPAEAPEAQNVIKTALHAEQHPAVLSQALVALRPGSMPPPEAGWIVERLQHLARHESAAVRGSSLLQLAQWHPSAGIEDYVYRGITDLAPEVQQAAVTAAAESGVRSERLKTALLAIGRNGNAHPGLRAEALRALEQFALDHDERAACHQARVELDRLQRAEE